MAKKSLLVMVQNACDELGITSPSSIIGNTDPQIKQLLALANREGKEVYEMGGRTGGWQELVKTYSFTTAGITGLTGNVTAGSAVITGISSTTGISAVTWVVTGNGLQYPSRIVSVDSSSQVTVDNPATISGTAVALTFGQDTYSMPSDFSYFVPQTFWDTPFRWQLLGPMSAQEWEVLKRGISPTGPRKRFRIMDNNFYIDPIPSTNTAIEIFEYYSNSWCNSSTGTAQTQWTADTDTYALNDELMIMGVKWRFLRAKGLDYSEESNEWNARLQRVMARNGGERTLPLNASSEGVNLLNNSNTPDTGFGQ